MITAQLKYDQKILNVQLNKSTIEDDLFVSFTEEKTALYSRLKLDIHPKKDVVIQGLEVRIKCEMAPSVKTAFCNGFQSWSESRQFSFAEQPDNLRGFMKPLMGFYGDYHFDFIPRTKGTLHSWTYGFLQLQNAINFVGSLSESTGFTCIIFDKNNGEIIIKKDLKGLELKHSFPALDLLIMQGENADVFDTYFKLQNLPKLTQKYATGWTSWYNYYNKISQEIIDKNLAAFKAKNLPIDIFQIDDGWQTKIGDWLSVKPTFPKGMKVLSDSIHANGFKAGLWLAPFIVEKNSDLFKQKSTWILRGSNGKPIAVGYSPSWGGKFFALDFYNEEVREYLTGVFHTVLDKWQFDMVKLDFLYAVCVVPRPNKTRGQIMHEAMAFLRQIVGNKVILACGVPLGSAFGQVDYCRIGADIHLKWEHKLLKFLRNRERVSTIVALRTVLNRWELNGQVFQNDPDVFILRKENHGLSDTQKRTILTINALLGNLLFCSDFVGDYTEGDLADYKMIFDFKDKIVQKIECFSDDFYGIFYSLNGENKVCYCNLNNQKKVQNNVEIEAFGALILNQKMV